MICIDGIVVFFGVRDIRGIDVDRTGGNGRCSSTSRREAWVAGNYFATEEFHTSGNLSEFLVRPPKDHNVRGAGYWVSIVRGLTMCKFRHLLVQEASVKVKRGIRVQTSGNMNAAWRNRIPLG